MTDQSPQSSEAPETVSPEKALAVIADNLPQESRAAAETEAETIAVRLIESPDDRSLLREITAQDDAFQSKANEQFSLLRTSLGSLMGQVKTSGASTSVPDDLKRLRDIMDEINPYSAIEEMQKAKNGWAIMRFIKRVPGVGQILSDIARKYESVQSNVEAIIISLEGGRDRLTENSIELEERYTNLKELQLQAKIQGYRLQMIFEKLKEAGAAADAELQSRLARIQAKLMRRIQNLAVTSQMFSQFFVTMNTTLDNHENLSDAISSMISLTRPVLENGLALKIAQQDEKQIAAALEATQDYLGSLMVHIAEDARDNAAYVTEVANKPLADFQDLVKSYTILKESLQITQEKEATMVAVAEKNVSELRRMTEELEKAAKNQEAARAAGEI